MKRNLLSALIAIALTAGSIAQTSAQEIQTYTETRTRTRTLKIDWHPEQKNYQRYTVSVSPLMMVNNGLKFDFEKELPRSGHWLGTSLSVYFAPRLGGAGDEWYNNRSSFISSFDDYHRMWGVGTSATYKYTFGHRGWYFATGLMLDFFRVGVATAAFVPYYEEGMKFYDYGHSIDTKAYFKPTVRFIMGKHMAISRRCFFDLYAGMGLSYSIYNDNGYAYAYDSPYYEMGYGYRYDYDYPRFDEMGGFAYRGLVFVGGFRFGVLLWKDLR